MKNRMKSLISLALSASVLAFGAFARAEIKIVVDHNSNENASAAFKFKNVPTPSKNDAATNARFTILDGERDDNGGDLDRLHDGKLPTEEDEPAENFFFNAGTEGGRLRVDLGKLIEIKQINTYSWHPNTRGPQVYKLYAADGKAEAFNSQPRKATDPEKCGWKLIAKVDTRPKQGEGGGQYGVGISDSDGNIGKYRYLLFDIGRTENDDAFGNTFYSEIDVIGNDSDAGAGEGASEPAFIMHSADGYCEISIDTSAAPNLKDWAENSLAPVLAEWYPKIVAMIPSEAYTAPRQFKVIIRPGKGVAATGGTRVTANSTWLQTELSGEAIGALVHEEVHIVQQYGNARRNNPSVTRSPGWLVEGIPDYIRWFKYEPQSHGADLIWMRTRRNFSPRYDGGYRVTANFLNWVTEKYDQDIVKQLNAAMRQGKYHEDLWKEHTGHTLHELADEWKAGLEEQLAMPIEPKKQSS